MLNECKKILFLIATVILITTRTNGIPRLEMFRHYEALFFTTNSSDAVQNEARKVGSRIALVHRKGFRLTVELVAFGEQVTIIVEPDKEFFRSGAIVEIHEQGRVRKTTVRNNSAYAGMVIIKNAGRSGAPTRSGSVYGYMTDDGVLVCDMSFRMNGSYHIEPARKYHVASAYRNAIIYRGSDVGYKEMMNRICKKDPRKCPAGKDALQDVVPAADDSVQELRAARSGPRRTKRQTKILTLIPEPEKIDERIKSSAYLKSPNGMKTCYVELVADHTYVDGLGRNEWNVIHSMMKHIKFADNLIRKLDFNQDGVSDNIRLVPAKFTVFSDLRDKKYIMRKASEIWDFLELFSRKVQTYCLSVAFSQRNYTFNALTMGYTAVSNPYGQIGGVCETPYMDAGMGVERSKNVFVVNGVKAGRVLPDSMVSRLFVHQVGHAFGSPHDFHTGPCSPGGSEGNYIMSIEMTDGSKRHHNEFSQCSLSYILPVLTIKGHCLDLKSPFLTDGDDTVALPGCGNERLDPGEECDCGSLARCEFVDHCCTPAGSLPDEKECTLRRSLNAMCSWGQGPCCTMDCQIAGPKVHCNSASAPAGKHSECVRPNFCSGSSASCSSELNFVPDGSPCMLFRKTCKNGRCASDICEDNGLKECPCQLTGDEQCEVCCLSEQEKCERASSLRLYNSGKRAFQLPGFPCWNETGNVCDGEGMCVFRNDPMFYDELDDASTWTEAITKSVSPFVEYKLGIALTLMATLLIVGVYVGCDHCWQLQSNHRRYVKRLNEARKKVDEALPEFKGGLKRPEVYRRLCRMVAFFPDGDMNYMKRILETDITDLEAIIDFSVKGYEINKKIVPLD